jgi:NitT/TauT family transport system substrate-binding protein
VALYPPTQGTPDIPQLVFVTSRAYATSNPDAIRNFTAALTRANGFLAENPEEIRRIGLSSTKVPPEILKTMRLPVFSAEPFDIGKLKRLEQYMLKYGVLKAPLNLKAYAAQD